MKRKVSYRDSLKKPKGKPAPAPELPELAEGDERYKGSMLREPEAAYMIEKVRDGLPLSEFHALREMLGLSEERLAGLLGLFLIMCAFGSAGLFASSLTREPTIAAVAGFGLVLMLWLTQILAYQDIPFAAVFGYLSLIGHFDSLRRGIFDTADVVYYVLFTGLFLWLTVQRLDLERS